MLKSTALPGPKVMGWRPGGRGRLCRGTSCGSGRAQVCGSETSKSTQAMGKNSLTTEMVERLMPLHGYMIHYIHHPKGGGRVGWIRRKKKSNNI